MQQHPGWFATIGEHCVVTVRVVVTEVATVLSTHSANVPMLSPPHVWNSLHTFEPRRTLQQCWLEGSYRMQFPIMQQHPGWSPAEGLHCAMVVVIFGEGNTIFVVVIIGIEEAAIVVVMFVLEVLFKKSGGSCFVQPCKMKDAATMMAPQHARLGDTMV
jgi:hypothetical protein